MIFSKIITGAVIGAFAGLFIFASVPAHGAAGMSSALSLGLEVIGISRTPAGSFVILQDSRTGKSGVYKAGAMVKGAKIVDVGSEQVVFERDGARQMVPLRKSAGSKQAPASMQERSGGALPGGPGVFPGAAEAGDETFTFEPVTNETGPAGEGAAIAELPYFEPITNDTGPVAPAADGAAPMELPEFTPVENLTGPVAE